MPPSATSRRSLATCSLPRWRPTLCASLAAACLFLGPLPLLIAAEPPAAASQTASPSAAAPPTAAPTALVTPTAAPAAPVIPSPAAPTRDQCLAAAQYSAQHAGRAVLVRHAGQVIFEQYDRGWSATQPHPLASGTKSFTGVLAMLAVQEGLLSLDERACDTLTEWRDDPRKSQISIRHLLTLSSGLEPGDRELGGRAGAGGVLGEGAAKRAKRLGLSTNAPRPENLNAVALELPTRHDPGTRFDYGPSHFYAFSELLERKLAQAQGPDKTTLAYLQNRLLKPLEITPFRIGRDRQGHPNLPGGMVLTPLEWSHFGQFVLDRGSVVKAGVEPRELLRPDLLAQCFEPSRANPQYGLTWWLKSTDGVADGEPPAEGSRPGLMGRLRRRAPQAPAFRDEHGQPLDVWMAAGLGKQRLFVVPARQLVVVRFAEAADAGQGFQDSAFLGPLLRSTSNPAASSVPATNPAEVSPQTPGTPSAPGPDPTSSPK